MVPTQKFLSIEDWFNNEAKAFLSKCQDGNGIIVFLKRLPRGCTPGHLVTFFLRASSPIGGTTFEEPEDPLKVLDGEAGALVIRDPHDGHYTQMGFALFALEKDAVRALEANQESCICAGMRCYCHKIKITRSTSTEVRKMLSGCLESLEFNVWISKLSLLDSRDQPLSRNDCLRLRGITSSARVEHIVEFFGDLAKHILFQGVHIVYKKDKSIGEAYVRMDSESSAAKACFLKNNDQLQIYSKWKCVSVSISCLDDLKYVMWKVLFNPTQNED